MQHKKKIYILSSPSLPTPWPAWGQKEREAWCRDREQEELGLG